MTRIGLIAAALLTVSASAALDQDDKPASITVTGASALKEGPPPKEKKICHSEPITGSLTRVDRICMTQRDWDIVAERSRDRVNDYIDQSQVPNRQVRDSQVDAQLQGLTR